MIIRHYSEKNNKSDAKINHRCERRRKGEYEARKINFFNHIFVFNQGVARGADRSGKIIPKNILEIRFSPIWLYRLFVL